MKYLSISMVALAVFSGCNGNNVKTVTIEAGRDYNPSSFTDGAVSLTAKMAAIPDFVDLVEGAAGTGWVELSSDQGRFCYQGNGGNNNTVGTGFVLRKQKLLNSSQPCSSSADDQAISRHRVFVQMLKSPVVLKLNGGGVSSGLQGPTRASITLFITE